MISILVASASVIASAPSLQAAFTPNDYPVWALKRDESAAAFVDALVDPDGRVSRCLVQETFGSKDLAGEICNIIMRKRLRPARDFHGNKTYGVVRTVLSMYLPDTRQGQEVAKRGKAADVVLTVTQLPIGKTFAEVDVLLAVDENGHVTDCGPKTVRDLQTVVEAVCSAAAELGAAKVSDTRGRPIRYVTSKKVELRVGGSPR